MTSIEVNIKTNRVKEKEQGFDGVIDDRLLKFSQEYFALAVLKYLYHQRYKDVVKSERPDLQGDGIGIEVTLVDLANDMQADKEFVRYHRDRCVGRINTIQKCGKHVIGTDVGIALQSGGGYNDCEIEYLSKRFDKKIKKSNKYKRFPVMELVLIKKDCPVQEWIEGLSEVLMPQIERKDNIFDRVYVIYPYKCARFERGSRKSYENIMSASEYKDLRIIGRMTAEGEISLGDEEWK